MKRQSVTKTLIEGKPTAISGPPDYITSNYLRSYSIAGTFILVISSNLLSELEPLELKEKNLIWLGGLSGKQFCITKSRSIVLNTAVIAKRTQCYEDGKMLIQQMRRTNRTKAHSSERLTRLPIEQKRSVLTSEAVDRLRMINFEKSGHMLTDL